MSELLCCEKVMARRAANASPESRYQELLGRAIAQIHDWEDPERRTWGHVWTRSKELAEQLIAELRASGYAADYLWSGSCSDDLIAVQFGASEDLLSREA